MPSRCIERTTYTSFGACTTMELIRFSRTHKGARMLRKSDPWQNERNRIPKNLNATQCA
jgi:hypothetical protein